MPSDQFHVSRAFTPDANPPTADEATWLQRAFWLKRQNRPIEAAHLIEKASLVAPVADEARILLASCYAQLRRTDLAREMYLQLALSRRLPPDLMLQVAAGLDAIDAPQLAMKVCEWITEQDETIAEAYFDMGIYSAKSGNALYLTEALTRRALQIDGGNVQYRIGLVALMIQLDRDDEALAAIGSLGEDDLAAVTCQSCLTHVAAMLRRHDRNNLADVCDRRIHELRSSSVTESHP